MSPTESK